MSSAWSAWTQIRPPTNPLTRGFTPGPHRVLRPQTHTIATAKQSCVCLFLWNCTKTVVTRAAPFGSDMHQIVFRLWLRPRPHWGSLHRYPRPHSWFKGWGPRGKGRSDGRGERRKEAGGVEGRESRNAQIQSWKAYLDMFPLVTCCLHSSFASWKSYRPNFNVIIIAWFFLLPRFCNILTVTGFQHADCVIIRFVSSPATTKSKWSQSPLAQVQQFQVQVLNCSMYQQQKHQYNVNGIGTGKSTC